MLKITQVDHLKRSFENTLRLIRCRKLTKLCMGRHLQYLVQGESFNAERKDHGVAVERSSRIAPFPHCIGPNRLIRSVDRIKRLVEVDFDVKCPIVLDALQAFVNLFLRHNHVKRHHQGIDYLWAKIQECYTILKLRSSMRSIKSNCVTCRKIRAATIQPTMSSQ